jgi:hypothetical protein
MKKAFLALAAGATLVTALPMAAEAAPWQSINQRQANLDRRIDRGVRRGDLTRHEAMRLRGEFRQLERLEARYRHHGLTLAERRDLDRRFDRLSSQVYVQRHDRQDRRY